MVDEGLNYVIEQILGRRQESKVGTFFNLLMLYLMKRIPAKDWPVLAAIMTFVDNNHYSEELYISATTVDICWVLTE